MIGRWEGRRLISLSRRQVLRVFPALVVPSGCLRARSREAVLAALNDEVVVPALLEAEQRSRDLVRAARRLMAAPAPPELTALRACWQRAALSWKRASAVRVVHGSGAEVPCRAAYWPARSAAVRELLSGAREPSETLMSELGADEKGLYALEYLLFDQEGEDTSWQRLSGGSGERARALIASYAEDVLARAVEARGGSLGGTARGSSSPAQPEAPGLERLIAKLAENVERGVVSRLSLVSWLASLGRLRPVDVEGGPSHTAESLLLSLLLSSQRLYSGVAGGGIAELVVRAAPPIHSRIASAFESAIRSLRAVPGPLHTTALSDRSRLDAALSAAKSLETAVKTELPSALGLSLAFAAFDAD